MKKKILIAVAIAGWVIFVISVLCFFGSNHYKAQIAKHQQEGFMRGINALQGQIIQEIKTQGSLRITIDGEERIFVPERNKKKKRK